jgi:hypothetical protein
LSDLAQTRTIVNISNQEAHIGNSANAEVTAALPKEERSVRAWEDHAIAAEAWERQHEAEWARVDGKLRGIAARRASLDAEEANLLRYAEELKLWRGFACGSMIEYMERAMGYAPHTAAERLRVARAIAELPLLTEALERGELPHSAVRELSRVAVPDTEDAWLEAARGKSLREIEALVSGHRPGHLPGDETEPSLHRKTITLEVSPETYDLWRKLHALSAEEHGQRLSDDELIQSLFRRAYGDDRAAGGNARDEGSRGRQETGTPAYKIAIKRCSDCKRAWQYSGGRDIEIDPAVAECAACDAVHLGSLDVAAPQRATTTVTPRKREQVLARDGHCCAVPGCRRNLGLDLHHIEYQSRGGGHELSNLTTLCDLHHRAVHFGKLAIRGTAPDRMAFTFRKPRDRRNVTDDDAPTPRSPPAVPSSTTHSPAQAAVTPESAFATAGPTWAHASQPPHAASGLLPLQAPAAHLPPPGAIAPHARERADAPMGAAGSSATAGPTWAHASQPPEAAAGLLPPQAPAAHLPRPSAIAPHDRARADAPMGAAGSSATAEPTWAHASQPPHATAGLLPPQAPAARQPPPSAIAPHDRELTDAPKGSASSSATAGPTWAQGSEPPQAASGQLPRGAVAPSALASINEPRLPTSGLIENSGHAERSARLPRACPDRSS